MSKHPTPPRDKKAIQADILSIQKPIAGTLSTLRRTLKNGQQKTYHILQRSHQGKHASSYVPHGQLEAVKKGIENRKRLELLMEEWLEAETRDALAPQNHVPQDPAAEAKKKRKTSSTASPRKSAKPSAPPSCR